MKQLSEGIMMMNGNSDVVDSPTDIDSGTQEHLSPPMKQLVRFTRSDPLNSTSEKSHLIRGKHNRLSGFSKQSPFSGAPKNSTKSNHYKERRDRWLRDRMADRKYTGCYNDQCPDCFNCEDKPPRSSCRQNSGANWISENDKKASKVHRPYSLREQRSWMGDNRRKTDDESFRKRNRLKAGISLPPHKTEFHMSDIPQEIDIRENGEDEEVDEILGPLNLTRQRKLPYPYCLKGHQRNSSDLSILGLDETVKPRRSRSGSPCSITSESTDSLGDCENALDPPKLLGNGDIGGPPVGSSPYCSSGRKPSVLFSSQDTWNEENIIQSFKELSPSVTALFEAAWTGDLCQLEELLNQEENLVKLKDTGQTGFRDSEGRTPLHLAAACGNLPCVKLLLEKGAPVNVTDGKENRATPLACAASCGSVPVVKALLAGGADVNSGYVQGKTALHWAVQASSLECAKVLLEAGAKQNPPQVYSETPLHVAASQGNPECLQLLLDYGAEINLCKGTNRSTALHLSCEEGSSTCVRLLLKAGASHVAKDIRGHTALHVAATCDADCVTALLKAGADPNAIDANGRTPLHCAVARGSRAAECVRLLVESRADIDAQDNYGYTPLHLSAVNESSQCASILLHHGSDVTLKTNAGTNALSLLVRRIPDVMRYLVDRLDLAVTIHDHDPADPDCEIRLDFRAIVPNCEKKNSTNGKQNGGSDKRRQSEYYFAQPHKETEFLTCLVAAGNKKILAHPLSEAFLTLKWRRVRKFFWASLLFQIALVALFTVYVVEVYLMRCPYRRGLYNNGSSGNDDSGELLARAVPLALPHPPVPPDARNLSLFRRRRNAERDFSWFGIQPRHPPQNKSKRPATTAMPPIQSPPVQVTPTPRMRERGRHNGILPPPPTPASSQPPRQPRLPPDEFDPEESEDPGRSSIEPIMCQLTPTLQVIWFLLVGFASLLGIKEIFQLIQSPFSYIVSSENWGQWLLICSVTMTAWSTPDSQLEYWQYPAAACGIFLAWGLMLLQVGRFPALGLYVQMLGKVAANFGLFILAYACLLIAFALAFCVLFPEHPPYSSVALSILKVFTMMVGEVDYEDLFYGPERLHDPVVFPITAHLLYGAFVVIVTIVLMNLLVGLAVHDIQGLQKGAKLNRLSRQTALISRLESFIFSKKLQKLLPRSLGSILQKSALLVPSSYNWSYYFRPNDPRDKRLPKDIKLASLRLASTRHSCNKSRPSHTPTHHVPSTAHRNTHMGTSSNTPIPHIIRPISSVSHHAGSGLVSNHQDIYIRRLEQRLDSLQLQLEKTLNIFNGRMDSLMITLAGVPPSPSPTKINNLSTSDNENDDNVFVEDRLIVNSMSISPSPSVLNRFRGHPVHRPAFSQAPSILKDVSTEKG